MATSAFLKRKTTQNISNQNHAQKQKISTSEKRVSPERHFSSLSRQADDNWF